jgi:Rieske Fe-S protein
MPKPNVPVPACLFASRREFVACLAGSIAVGSTAHLWANAVFVTGEPGLTPAEKRYPVPSADGVTIDRTAQVVIVRSEGHAFAFSLACPHESAAVKWVDKDHRFQCTKHDSRYTIDGTHVAGRATRNMDRFPIRLDGASLVVTTDATFHSDTDPKGWAAAAVPV